MQAVYTQLQTISRRASARSRRTAEPLTLVQHTLLNFIDGTPECRAIDIAGAMRLNRSTVSRQVGDLQAIGLIEVGAVTAEQTSRGQLLTLSKRGRELLDRSIRANHDELERRLSEWSDDEIDDLAAGLERFNADEERSPS
ncbi:DNA-binding MarR family transcriptional regulator [Frondihabitans sp. PhB188]|nr:DNA-binding MarR family transcriptional regulator [Frondihabitans sp. PhB188]